MGLIETLLEHVSLRSASNALLLVVVAYVLHSVYVSIDKNRRLRRLGARPPKIRNKLPWGFDFVQRAIKATMEHKNLELWRENFEVLGCWTLEVNTIGRRVLFTADVE